MPTTSPSSAPATTGSTCAAYLAGAGLRVIVLEKNAVVGGAAVTEEFHPGFRNSVAAYTVSLLNPMVIRDLELERHGLRIVERPVANFWPVDERRYLLMPYGLANRQRAIAAFSARDAERLPAYDAALERAAAFLRELALQAPPNAGGGILELIGGAALGAAAVRPHARRQAAAARPLHQERGRFPRTAGSRARWSRARFAFDSIVGAYASPYTPGTAYVLLHHCFGEVNGKPGVWGHAVGGMGAITQAMARRGAGERRGHPHRGARSQSLIVEDGRASRRPAGLRRAHRRACRGRQRSARSCCSAISCPTAPSSRSCARASSA